MTRAANLANFADETILTVDGVNNRVGIGSTQPTEKLDVVGVVSATSFHGSGANLTGVVASNVGTLSALNVTGIATFGNNVSIAGTLTYEDVTNIDSVGIITARSDISIADKIIHTGDTNTAIRFPAVDTFTVETGGSERTRVDSSGNLIIGSTSAATNSQITLRSASPHLSLYGTPGSNTSQLNLGDTDDHDIGNISYDHSDNSMRFTANASERLRITSAGLVRVPDNGKFTAGAGDDLEIYHDGTDNFIKSNTALKIQAAGSNSYTIHVSARTDKETIICYNNTNAPYVELYYNNSKKFETTSAGVTVTGTVSDSIGPLRRLGIHAGAGVNFSLTAGHAGYLSRATASGITVTVPLDFATAGDMFSVFNVSTGNISIAPAGGVTMYNTADGTTVTRTLAAKGLVTILCSGTNEFLISGTGLS